MNIKNLTDNLTFKFTVYIILFFITVNIFTAMYSHSITNLLTVGLVSVAGFIYVLLITKFLFINSIKRIGYYAKKASAGDLDVRIPLLNEDDEFGQLAKQINTIISHSEKLAHKILAEKEKQITARQAGMAEVATAVLHNVGNVLNSINVSVSFLKTKISQSQLNNLSDSIQLLRENKNNMSEFITKDPKGKLLIDFFEMLNDSWHKDQENYIAELSKLEENLQHIKQIICMQQSYAGHIEIIETHNVEDILEDALQISILDYSSADIEIERDYDFVDPINIDKAKLMQILINLIKNAIQALMQSEATCKKLTLRIKLQDQMICIQVIDNGVGIEKESLTKIFSHGYTTKKDGHGFGLNSCSIIAKELNGKLEAASDGINDGACFTLKFPMTQMMCEKDKFVTEI